MTGFLNPRIPQGLRNAGAVAGAFDQPAPYAPVYPLTLQNGDAETGDFTGWTISAGIYAPENVSTATGRTSAQGGTRFFRGTDNSSATNAALESAMWQNISIDTSEVADVDAELMFIDFSFYQEAGSSEEDDVETVITFYNAANVNLGGQYRRVWDCYGTTANWTLRSVVGVPIPAGCRYFEFKVNFKQSPTSQLASRRAYVDTIVLNKVLRDPEIEVLHSRLYAILGPQETGITVEHTRLYAILGPQETGVTVEHSRLYAIIIP